MNLENDRTGVEAKFFELCSKIVPDQGYTLYDMEYIPGQTILRVFIMDEETKTAVIEDCVKVDRSFTPFMEELTWIPDTLVLEVSSPGAERALKTKAHFEAALEKNVCCTVRGELPVENNEGVNDKVLKQKKYVGTLLSIEESGVHVDDKSCKVFVPFEAMKKANIEIEL